MNPARFFEWQVPVGGVRLIRIEPSGIFDSFVTPVRTEGPNTEQVIVPAKNQWVSYRPLEQHTGLFLTLAETPTNPDAIVAFASRLGFLDGRHPSRGGGGMCERGYQP